jgi:cytochrome P450
MASEIDVSEHPQTSAAHRCPIDHSAISQQKTARVTEQPGRPLERDGKGVWHVRSYEQARSILRGAGTRQAGFNAEFLERLPSRMIPPILYQEGKPHHEQRKLTARFFTPKTVSESYQQPMERYAERVIAQLRQRKSADLTAMSMQLAVRVASQVVGLTNSRLPGMTARINAFFKNDQSEFKLTPRGLLSFVRGQSRVLAFYLLDVKPAISARRRQPREDVISHLLSQGSSDLEILTECITYAAAGMVTTREFIAIAAWHLLEQPELRATYLAAGDEQRELILQELLRLEPVVGNLYRRTTEPLEIEGDAGPTSIPRGSLINLHLYAINADPAQVGELPLQVCPGRQLQSDRAGPAVMSFGDGAHRCPGSYIALQETDIFLRKLFKLPGLRIVQKPAVSWNEVSAGYELHDFMLAVD